MRNVESWRPSKFIRRRGKLRGSFDQREVGVASRIMSDAVAAVYDVNLPRFASGRLVDLGCGKVPLYLAYRDLVDEVVCVDWPQSMHGNSLLDHECDLNEPLPFAAATFDTVILSDVLEHIPEPAALCAEIARVLRPGGHVLLNTPFLYWMHETPHDYYRYTEYSLRRLLGTVGLRPVVFESIGGAGCVIVDLIAKQVASIPLIGRMAAATVQAAVVPRARPVGEPPELFPLGYFVVASRG